ncbi:unnamed protein product [Caenorhabditis bovis]|uniref:Branched-chain-amino-acid aminotransferase n=1 Tax=Caenorhabditis bovis TaxID=2654633 RepID=A0A8S1E6U1_9PELO|nr:unnamed protein product [Caenorhabditis bovis]
MRPFGDFNVHPAAKGLHYAVQLFEVLKAYRGVDGKFRIFRPDKNIERMKRTAIRSCLPDFHMEEALQLLDELVRVESHSFPEPHTGSFYIRPMMFSTDTSLGLGQPKSAKWACFGSLVSNYFNYEKGLRLLADPTYIRSWPGGVGQYKMGCNYAPTFLSSSNAAKLDCDQVIWLSGENQLVTEAGAMNLFVLWKNEEGEDELITPPLTSGLLLPGITRLSVLELAREWNCFIVAEKDFTMNQLSTAIKENRVYEIFSAGTAAVVGPVSEILYIDKRNNINETLAVPTIASEHKFYNRVLKTMTQIHYGEIERKEWQRVVDL